VIFTVSDTAKSKKGGRRKRHTMPGPTLNQKTRERLYLEALAHPKFQGMEESEVRAFIDAKLDVFLGKQPWWYGHIDDTKHHAAQRQYKARKEKERLSGLALKMTRQQDSELEDRGESEDEEIQTVIEELVVT